jgi:peptidoglycan hydrolase-like protein with peptidoglycan-binding domain
MSLADYRPAAGRGTVQEMAGRDERDMEPGGAYDDWFDEPEPPLERRRRGQRRGPDASVEDAWVFPESREREARPSRRPLVIAGRTVTTTQAAIIAVSGLVILLAILAAAGVFSSGSTPAAQPPTVPKTTPPTVTPSTTTPATTKQSVPAPTAALKPGDTGAQVKVLQKALNSLGFSSGTPDGNYGPGTKAAVAAFQNSKELTADGIFGSATLAALQQALSGSTGTGAGGSGAGSTSAQAPTTTLKPGDTGAQVKTLQQALKALGYTIGTIDGQYGPGTTSAVQAFQNAQGLGADGVVGPKTLAALQQALSSASG